MKPVPLLRFSRSASSWPLDVPSTSSRDLRSGVLLPRRLLPPVLDFFNAPVMSKMREPNVLILKHTQVHKEVVTQSVKNTTQRALKILSPGGASSAMVKGALARAAAPRVRPVRGRGGGQPSIHKGKRYAPASEKGPSAWKNEWSTFMSGVRLKDGAVKLAKCMDFTEAEGSSFSYLFADAADKKAARKDAEKKDKAAKKAQVASEGPSKMKKLTDAVTSRGVSLVGMNRAQRRQLLKARITEAEAAARQHQRQVKPHELMDDKLAWYQQGPSPLDEVSEKLVTRKALKQGRQLQLKYNYLLVHPSWLASRQRNRRECKLLSLGTRTCFPD